MERNMVSQAHEALQAAHEALRTEAQQAGEISAEQRRTAAARDEAKDAEEAAAVAQLHARMGELQVGPHCSIPGRKTSLPSRCGPSNSVMTLLHRWLQASRFSFKQLGWALEEDSPACLTVW